MRRGRTALDAAYNKKSALGIREGDEAVLLFIKLEGYQSDLL